MSQDEFKKQLEIATSLVEMWPAWKKNILELYSSSTVSVPRTPVQNNRVAGEGENTEKAW